jgi:hypothetical protein
VLAGGAVGLVAALGVGGAVAAPGSSPQEESTALLQDVAKRLGLDAGTVRPRSSWRTALVSTLR